MGSALPLHWLHADAPSAAPALLSLQQTLRALWGLHVPVVADGEVPHLSAGGIHLPRTAPAGCADTPWQRAAAAHAAAHLVYSPQSFDGRGLRPIVRALVGVLEDARVETLSGRELPGLQRWWRPLHTVVPADGDGVETLLLRLARALVDPGYDDPHPWVRKGRALFFLDARGEVLAEPRAEGLREIASRLGHDLGQMRLQFNARGYLPGPGYRDDHRWMWPSGADDSTEPFPATPPPGRSADEPPPAPGGEAHPEWDRLIARLRPAWCRVHELRDEAGGDGGIALPQALSPAALRRAVAAGPARGPWRIEHEGERLDVDALLRARIARRARLPLEARLHRDRSRGRRVGHALLLIDQSASTSTPWAEGESDQLRAACAMAWQAAQALASAGLRTSIAGFASNGRHAVHWQSVQAFGEPLDRQAGARLAALRSSGSTRLGAALRHATRRLARQRGGEQLVLVFSDALAHDIDVHDPRYLAEDARHAARHAQRQGQRLACIAPDRAQAAAARAVFGAAQVAVVERLEALPAALRRLLG